MWDLNCLWELPSRWAKLCEILSHSVRYGIYANGRSNFRINTIGSKGVQIFRVITVSIAPDKGPVVQSVVSLTSSLRAISLTILADSINNFLKFFAEKM